MNIQYPARIFSFALLALFFAMCSVLPNAIAQNAESMDEIIVTATKRNESLMDVPMSITVLGQETIETTGMDDATAIAQMTPGLTFNMASNNLNPSFVIRGISVQMNDGVLQKAVSTYLDEMPMSDAKSTLNMDFGLYDVKQVEVLKGPQGTLFGAGTLAGAVRIITNKPDPSGFDYHVGLDLASTSGEMRQRYKGMINLPISEGMAVRFVAAVTEEDGFIDNIGTGVENANNLSNTAVRAMLGWQISDRLKANLTLAYMENEADDGNTINPALGSDTRSNFLPENTIIELKKYNATLKYDFNFATLTSSTNYSESDPNQNTDLSAIWPGIPVPPPLFMDHGLTRIDASEAFVQEFRLVSKDNGSGFDWVFGAFFLDRETKESAAMFTSDAWLASTPGGAPTPSGFTTSLGRENAFIYGGDLTDNHAEEALFAELGYQLTDSVKAIVGFRTGEVEIETIRECGGSGDIFSMLGPIGFGAPAWTPAPYCGPRVAGGVFSPGSQSTNTMKVSLAWQATDNLNAYFSASEGFRGYNVNRAGFSFGAGGVQGASQTDPNDIIIEKLSKPDKLWNYELGIKGQWDAVSANIAVYRMVWEDIQLNAQRVSDPSQFTTNAGEAESEGIEMEVLARLNDNFEFGLNLAIQNAEITKLTADEALRVGAVVGSELVSPNLQASGHFQYTTSFDSGNEAYGRLDFSHTGDMPNGFPNRVGSNNPSPNYQYVDAYTKIDLSFGWISEKYSVTLYGENILDNDDYIFVMPDTFFDDRHMTLRPRTFGLRFSMRH